MMSKTTPYRVTRSPDKRRYLNALGLVAQEEVPFVETEADFKVVEAVLGRSVPGVKTSYHLPPADYIEFLTRMGMDMAYLAVPWKLARREYIDADGRSLYVDGTLKTRADLKRIRDPGDDAIKRRLDEMCAALDGTGIGIIYNHWNTPVVVTTAMGYEDYYSTLLTDPEFIKECHQRVDEVILRQLKLILTYPVDAHLITVILAMSSGPIMSEAIVEEFEMPYLQRNLDLLACAHLPASFHCDGDNRKYYPRLIDMGIRCLQAIDPCGGRQDIYALKAAYGHRVALHGNIDCELLISGTPKEIAADVVAHIDRLSVGGGYICSSSHDLNERMPMENIWAMVRAIHETKGHVTTRNS
jgi:hypothetical protein